MRKNYVRPILEVMAVNTTNAFALSGVQGNTNLNEVATKTWKDLFN